MASGPYSPNNVPRPSSASNAPGGFGIPKAISPVADNQGTSIPGVTYADNDAVGAAGQPVSNSDRAKAVARRLQSAVNASREENRTKDRF